MILLFYPFFVWGEKTISAAGGDFPIQSIIFLHKAPMDYKMIWTTINLYRSLILARSLIMILFIHALSVCTKVQNYLSKIGLAAIICHEKLCKIGIWFWRQLFVYNVILPRWNKKSCTQKWNFWAPHTNQ